MKFSKRLLPLLLAIVMVLSSTVALAANGDVYHRVNNELGEIFATAAEAALNKDGKGVEIALNESKYLFEYNDKYYDVQDLLSAYNADDTEDKTEYIKDLVENYEPVVDSEILDDLEVVEVSAINLNGVTLTLKALEEDMMEATVTVVDPNGKEVAVKAQDLSAGDTEVVFAFEKAYTDWKDMPAGIWTVNGTEYDFSAQLAVKAVKEAKTQVALLEALKSDYFKNVKAENIDRYDGQFDDCVTVADVQKVIDKVNGEAVSEDNVKAVKEAKNQVELLVALQNGGFARVNADWIDKYFAVKPVETDTIDAEGVQDKIDTVNEDAILKVDNDSESGLLAEAEKELKTESITNVENLINTYVKDDEEGVTTKKDLLDRVAVHKAVIAVNEATTNNTLKSRLVSLAEVVNDASIFNIKTVNDVLLKEYREAIAGETDVTKKNNATAIQTIVTNVNEAELGKAVKAIENNFTGYIETDDFVTKENQAKALKELNRLADVSEDVKAKDIDEELIVSYVKAIAEDLADTTNGTIPKATTDTSKAQAIQTLIEGANANVLTTALTAVTSASDADALLEALKNKDLALKNVVDANKDAYSEAPVNKNAVSYFTKVTTVAEAQKVVNAVNAFVDANKATSATQLNSALNSFVAIINDDFFAVNEAPNYIDLSSAAKLEVAEIVFNAKEADYADAMELAVAIDTAVNAYDDFLNGANGVNKATSISEMNAALNKENVLPEFFELDAAEKVEKAEAVYNKLQELQAQDPATEFKTIAEIKEAAGL